MTGLNRPPRWPAFGTRHSTVLGGSWTHTDSPRWGGEAIRRQTSSASGTICTPAFDHHVKSLGLFLTPQVGPKVTQYTGKASSPSQMEYGYDGEVAE